MKKYKCISISGGGQEYDEVVWVIKTNTPKTLIVKKIDEDGVYNNYTKGETIRCREGNGNILIDHEDGTFTIYPNQSGVPYYFKEFRDYKKQGGVND